MNAITKIIEQNGGIEALKGAQLKIENEGYMALVIEHVGKGPRGCDLVSVAHYYEQNGDLMADPEMTFERGADGELHPITYKQDGVGLFQEAVWVQDGQTLVRPQLLRQLKAFARSWSKNLREQGFLKQPAIRTAR
jgi:hypothetical protein